MVMMRYENTQMVYDCMPCSTRLYPQTWCDHIIAWKWRLTTSQFLSPSVDYFTKLKKHCMSATAMPGLWYVK